MVKGLFLMEWNVRLGCEIIYQHPPDFSLSTKTLLQIFAVHESSSEAGIASITIGALNSLSYYSGEPLQLYLVLLLDIDENVDAYEEILEEVAQIVFQSPEPDKLKHIFSQIYSRLATYPLMEKAQKLAIIYLDDKKRAIIERLVEEGCILKEELELWLKDKYRNQYFNLNTLLSTLIRQDIVKIASVKSAFHVVIFLTNVIYAFRAPPASLVNVVKETHSAAILEKFKKKVQEYFQIYRPTVTDAIEISTLLADNNVYQILKVLQVRTATRSDLDKLKNRGVEDIDVTLNKLTNTNVIMTLQDGNEDTTKYYALKSDLKIVNIYPGFVLNLIRQKFARHEQNKEVLLEYLKVLKEPFSLKAHTK